jgi:tight adherence protein C
MNLEFLFAAVFGLGVGGLLSKLQQTNQSNLAFRLSVKPLGSKPAIKGNFKTSGFLLLNQVRSENSSKLERALFELPEIIDLLVVSLRSGNGIYRSFATVIPHSSGALAEQLARVLRAVELGAAFGIEIKQVSKALPHPQVSEFVNKVSLALERGTPLAQMLTEQGVSVREEIKSRLLKQAGKNETRMLIPLVFLILPITVLFAIYPSLELLNFGFI